MDVFHYVADQLRDTSLFEVTTKSTTLNGFGAIFNEFDNPSPFDDATNPKLSFSSQTTELSAANETSHQIISLPEVDHAILESDRVEDLWNEDLAFNTDLFDYRGEAPDESYYEKVFLLLTMEQATLEKISDKAKLVFEIRLRNNWALGDTIYDA